MKYVLDASVAVRWYLSDEEHPNADAVLERILESPELFAVPELFFFEVYAVLARRHPRPAETYHESFLPIVESGIYRHPMTAALSARGMPFLARGLSGYDACYAGLADELGARWITFDRQAPRARCRRRAVRRSRGGIADGLVMSSVPVPPAEPVENGGLSPGPAASGWWPCPRRRRRSRRTPAPRAR
jgi:predicted nucleic acid-binding protein